MLEVPSPPPAATRAALAFILVTVGLDVIALGIIIPVLPKLVESMAGGDTVRAAELFGLFGTAWALMQLVSSPVLGALSDRFGRRPVLLLSTLGLGLDYILMAVAPNLVWLFIGRLLSGITAATFSTANAYIADVTPPDRRAGAFGLVGAAFGVGFVLGPAIGGIAGDIDPSCRSGSRPASRSPTSPTASWCCPSPCRRHGAWRSAGAGPIRWDRCGCCRSTARSWASPRSSSCRTWRTWCCRW